MADPPRHPHTDTGSSRDTAPGMPRWVMLLGVALVIVVLLFAVMMLSGGGLGGHVAPRH